MIFCSLQITTSIYQYIHTDFMVLFRLLQNNQLSGPIPSEIGKLSELGTIDLSGNQFSGEIPMSLGLLTNLNYL